MSAPVLRIRRLRPGDGDLDQVATELNAQEWEDFDYRFSGASLLRFVEENHHIYLVAYWNDALAGAAHAYLLPHPTGHLIAYVDEVDTLSSFRLKGVAKAMMKEILELSRRQGATEAWLGTEEDNLAAKALYHSLGPSEVESPDVIFTYKLVEQSRA